MNNTVYLIPGRGNKLNELGDIVSPMGFDIYGREILPPFSDIRFSDQLRIIRRDIVSLCWDTSANLIGHSYGAYLLLHALSEMESFPGRIIFFSPVLGEAVLNKEMLYGVRPPGDRKLRECFENHRFPVPSYLEIHIGENDDGCHPELAIRIGALIPGAKLNLVKNQGHKLDPEYTRMAMSEFLIDRG